MKIQFITLLLSVVLFSSCKKESKTIDPCDLPADSFFIAEQDLAFLNFPRFDTLYFGNYFGSYDKYYLIDTIPNFSYLTSYCYQTVSGKNQVSQERFVIYKKVSDTLYPEEYLQFHISSGSGNWFLFTYYNTEEYDFAFQINTDSQPDLDSLTFKDKAFYNVYRLDHCTSQFSDKIYYYNLEYGLVAIKSPSGWSYLQTDMLE